MFRVSLKMSYRTSGGTRTPVRRLVNRILQYWKLSYSNGYLRLVTRRILSILLLLLLLLLGIEEIWFRREGAKQKILHFWGAQKYFLLSYVPRQCSFALLLDVRLGKDKATWYRSGFASEILVGLGHFDSKIGEGVAREARGTP
jgi:hypothetical protein